MKNNGFASELPLSEAGAHKQRLPVMSSRRASLRTHAGFKYSHPIGSGSAEARALGTAMRPAGQN
jgi:hypothetical protein